MRDLVAGILGCCQTEGVQGEELLEKLASLRMPSQGRAKCASDGALNLDLNGIEGTHVFWCSQGGLGYAGNGLVPRAIRHALFDLATSDPNYVLTVSVSPQHLKRNEPGQRLAYHLGGRPSLDPSSKYSRLNVDHIVRYTTQDFKAVA